MDMFFREFLGLQLIQIGLAYPGCVTPRKPLGEGHWIRSGNRVTENQTNTWVSCCRFAEEYCVCMLGQDGTSTWRRSLWCPHKLCLSRVGPPYPSLVLASVWGHSAHRWPGVGRTARGPLWIVQRIPLGFWPTYWMLSRWQRDDALTCSLGSKYLSG